MEGEGVMMTSEEVSEVMADLGLSYAELAEELGVSERSVRRWAGEGCDGAAEAALALAERLYGLIGEAWRKNTAAIGLNEYGGIVFLQEIMPGDVAVFARGTAMDKPAHPSFNDSEHL